MANTDDCCTHLEVTIMPVPTQITFRGLDSSDWIRERIQEEADKLGRFDQRIVRCRVVVQAPNQRHRQGRLYKVSINIEIPGQDVRIGRSPPANHAHEDVKVAIRDAFAAATRRLEDSVRERRHDVKNHTPPEPHGRVSRLIAEENYGFIETPDGDEVYFHANSVANHGFAALRVGSKVRFAAEQGEKGRQASIVKPIG